MSTCRLSPGFLQFVHPKRRGPVLVVDQREVLYPHAQLVSTFQREHLSLRGGAQVLDGLPVDVGALGQAAVRLHHDLLLLRLALPQLDLADQRDVRAAFGEGHPGVDVVVARLLDGHPHFVVVADVPQNGVLDVPLEEVSCGGREAL